MINDKGLKDTDQNTLYIIKATTCIKLHKTERSRRKK